MTLETVTLRLPRALLVDAQTVARGRDLTLGEMIRQYLSDEVHAQASPKAQRDAAARARLTPIFAAANDWADLQTALSLRGYALKAHGTGLAIYHDTDTKFLCNTASVGHRYRKLVKRFGAPMPGHAHGAQWIPSATKPDEMAVLERPS